jgi:hypothetical protein
VETIFPAAVREGNIYKPAWFIAAIKTKVQECDAIPHFAGMP